MQSSFSIKQLIAALLLDQFYSSQFPFQWRTRMTGLVCTAVLHGKSLQLDGIDHTTLVFDAYASWQLACKKKKKKRKDERIEETSMYGQMSLILFSFSSACTIDIDWIWSGQQRGNYTRFANCLSCTTFFRVRCSQPMFIIIHLLCMYLRCAHLIILVSFTTNVMRRILFASIFSLTSLFVWSNDYYYLLVQLLSCFGACYFAIHLSPSSRDIANAIVSRARRLTTISYQWHWIAFPFYS